MEFKKYPSIENSYRERFIEGIKNAEYGGDTLWIAEEKIHGANFSFYTDGTDVKVAQRNSFSDGTFYGCQPVIDKYSPIVKSLFALFKANLAIMLPVTIEYIIFYGELCGGSGKGSKKVQTGVDYFDEQEFVLFDVAFKLKETDRLSWIIWDVATKQNLNRHGMKVPETLATGKLDDLLLVDANFTSLIKNIEGNIAEGYVLKPVVTTFLDRGDRVILKSKSETFKESKPTKAYVEKAVSYAILELLEKANVYITMNRLLNVLSKIGITHENFDSKMFGKVSGLFTKDVLDELAKDGILIEVLLPTDELKEFKKLLNGDCVAVLREWIKISG